MSTANASEAAKAAGCPVAHTLQPDGSPSAATNAAVEAFAEASRKQREAPSHGCPVHPGATPKTVLNAETELPPNQLPAPDQRKNLPTDRATSNIPSGSSKEPLWQYPSEQMFYNAMKRKGYTPHEEEMNAVVAIHNAVNERAWGEVLAWEHTLHPECTDTLRLLRFQGKPEEPSMKAQANALLGYRPPFDRHDWVVSRCGKEVSYLIDFYHGRASSGRPVAMHIDARPKADDWDGAWDRVRMPFVRIMSAWSSAAGSSSSSS